MLRFILVRRVMPTFVEGSEHTTHETIDLSVPELEELLARGGVGNGGYDRTALVGVEVIPEEGGR